MKLWYLEHSGTWASCGDADHQHWNDWLWDKEVGCYVMPVKERIQKRE